MPASPLLPLLGAVWWGFNEVVGERGEGKACIKSVSIVCFCFRFECFICSCFAPRPVAAPPLNWLMVTVLFILQCFHIFSHPN